MFVLILGYFYSIESVGQYSLIQTTSQLLMPVIGLNFAAAIMHTPPDNKAELNTILKLAILIPLIGLIPIYFITTFFHIDWLSISIPLACAEAIFLAYLTKLRVVGQDQKYLTSSLAKSLTFLAPLIFVYFIQKVGIYKFTTIQIVLTFLVVIIFVFKILFKDPFPKLKLIKDHLHYTLPLIPHSLSLWALSSSDRYFIDHFLGTFDLGRYSIIYAFSMVILVVNAGFNLSLQQLIVQNKKIWNNGNKLEYLINKYNVIACIVLFLVSGIIVFNEKIQIFPIQGPSTLNIFLLIYFGLYYLGIANIYNYYLNAIKKTKQIALNTIATAIINIILNAIFIKEGGIIAAAATTFISYLFLMIATQQITFRYFPEMKKNAKRIYINHLISLIFIGIILFFIYGN